MVNTTTARKFNQVRNPTMDSTPTAATAPPAPSRLGSSGTISNQRIFKKRIVTYKEVIETLPFIEI